MKQNEDKRKEQMEQDACGIGAIVRMDGEREHVLVEQALTIVEQLEHRAGKDASGEIGDGVGILTQIPHRFFAAAAHEEGSELPAVGDYGVAMLFLSEDEQAQRQAMETIVSDAGADLAFWRKVKVHEELLHPHALASMPAIWQCFITRPAHIARGLAFERFLYLLRRRFERRCPDAYVVSMSASTIVYKGMLLVGQLRAFYADLQDERYESALAMVHSRFSTNTQPSWKRAHPNRMIAHNGEINTIRGNRGRMQARESVWDSPFLRENHEDVLPIVNAQGSDSAMLDNTLEFLYLNGMPIEKAVATLIPHPWQHASLPRKLKDFYHYHATLMEPWDGPAAVLFSDGVKLGAALDRNGLRPLRWWQTDDGHVILSSETGVLPIAEEHIIRKDRLRPGELLVIDTAAHRLIRDEECKLSMADEHPYGEWLDRSLIQLKDLPAQERKPYVFAPEHRDFLYRSFAYTYEDVRDQILPMAKNGIEPTASMGTDIPLAVLSSCHPLLFHYFKQLFAQVTNPPIDSLREKIVTDTAVYLGAQGNLLAESAEGCRVLEIHNPILDGRDMDKLRTLVHPQFKTAEISLLYDPSMSIEQALDQLEKDCDAACDAQANLLLVSDRAADEQHLIIPSLLAVATLSQHLVRIRRKTAVSIVLESGEPRDVHQFALLLGFGASAIYPYLAHECIRDMVNSDVLDKEPHAAVRDYNDAILHGIVKIAAKMGISTIQSYQSARIFEAVGIDQQVMDRSFGDTPASLGGMTFAKIDADIRWHHAQALAKRGPALVTTGFHRLRSGEDKERHLYDPLTITTLQEAVRENDYEKFKTYTAMLHGEHAMFTVRSALEFDHSQVTPIPLDEVEPIEAIVTRFKTGAMSYGSISEEAHTTLALAMNALHGKSNSGEGGERPQRLGTARNSAIKQVASGRFGVTSEYLCSADEIQIKMAQGAKPGEGGHLPGRKVYPWIAKTRHSTPGVTLISPPPHHDIYSIEDLAQLIYDLKNANPKARMSVKLVAEHGVGTVACGVAKAGAQVILISGYDGGTGAAPQSSIHHAGMPWEIGLAQTQKELVENHLRSRVRLETDGKLMSGRDVAIAAMLGAEEFGFATGPLVAMGCMMMRVCNLDTCPVGIATQNECLRRRFQGKPEHVIHFMRFVAQELREIMASLGVRTVDELIGRKDLLKVSEHAEHVYHLQLQQLLEPVKGGKVRFDPADVYDFHLEQTIDAAKLIPGLDEAMKRHAPFICELPVHNTDRSFGTLLGSHVTSRYGVLPDDACRIRTIGSGGQSYGAFVPAGISLELEGDANDYFGKGLSGGRLVVHPSPKAPFRAQDNIIIGNVALYGATSGTAYVCGQAGERFAVRNSGATAVVEGCGDHALEYMTGGCVVILGRTGRNVAAGMSGGVAYILDEDHDLYLRVNRDLVEIEDVDDPRDIARLKEILTDYVRVTHSEKGSEVLEQFMEKLPLFRKIIPHDYRVMTENIERFMHDGCDEEEAQRRAFAQMYES